MDCYQVERERKAEAIRLNNERAEADYRQEQLAIEAAQLQELQEQREVLEEELSEMNETQSRMEEMHIDEQSKANKNQQDAE